MGSSVDHHLCNTGYQAGTENGRLEPPKLRGVNRDLLEQYLEDGVRRGPAPEGSFSGPDFLNFAPNGTLYVSDNNKRVYSFTITG